jgi:prepilin-type N-terminal cleavage/methylation domain-containing protein
MKKGFTLIELLVVIAILAVLFSSLIILINPATQMAKARDVERESHLHGILGAVYQYSAEHSGNLPDTDGDPETESFPTTATCIGSGSGCFNLGAAGDDGDTIVPDYIVDVPFDPKTGDASNTGYTIFKNANNRLEASATGERTETITVVK